MHTSPGRFASASLVAGLVAASLLVPTAAHADTSYPSPDALKVRFECGTKSTMVVELSLIDGSRGSGSGDIEVYAAHYQDGVSREDSLSFKTFHWPGKYTWEVPLDSVSPVLWGIGKKDGSYWTTLESADLPKDCWSPFQDVPYGSTFYKEIRWMSEAGISTGYALPPSIGELDPYNHYLPRQVYRPYDSVTRDAMAAFLYRFAGSPTYTAPATSPFADVPTTSPFYKEIAWLAEQKVSTGWVEGSSRVYRPYSPITRDAMAAFLKRLLGDKLPAATTPTTSPFVDVPTNNPFYAEITWLAQNGISTGWETSGGKKEFRPFANITRDAMAAFLFRTDALTTAQ